LLIQKAGCVEAAEECVDPVADRRIGARVIQIIRAIFTGAVERLIDDVEGLLPDGPFGRRVWRLEPGGSTNLSGRTHDAEERPRHSHEREASIQSAS
jgi:hypothetical protein